MALVRLGSKELRRRFREYFKMPGIIREKQGPARYEKATEAIDKADTPEKGKGT